MKVMATLTSYFANRAARSSRSRPFAKWGVVRGWGSQVGLKVVIRKKVRQLTAVPTGNLMCLEVRKGRDGNSLRA